MNVAIDTEKPTCIRISVSLWFRTPNVPPYTDTRGTMRTWNGMTMEATIAENISAHAGHF